jgi:hypothetical protein
MIGGGAERVNEERGVKRWEGKEMPTCPSQTRRRRILRERWWQIGR